MHFNQWRALEPRQTGDGQRRTRNKGQKGGGIWMDTVSCLVLCKS